MKNAALITIGDELLLGQTIDSNAAWIGWEMSNSGCPVVKHYTVGDKLEEIITAFDEAYRISDIILITGGLGPTRDDITKKAIAEYWGVEMTFSERAWQVIVDYFEEKGGKPNELHHAQCFLPDNARLLENRAGTAPGMLFEKNGKIFISMPGVPYEMKYIMTNSVLPLVERNSLSRIYHRTVCTFGISEPDLAMKIVSVEDTLPHNAGIAYLPSLGEVRLRVTVTGTNEEETLQTLEKIVADIKREVGEYIYGYDKDTLEEVVQYLCISKKLKLGLAESCTGGEIASRIVKNQGSSSFFEGSVVCYSNRLKNKLLDVKEETLNTFGAVSAETASEMVQGVIKNLGVDIGVGVTGIAGPAGDGVFKKVGTVFIAVGDQNNSIVEEHFISKDRVSNIKFFSNVAFNMLRKFLIDR